MERGIFLTLGIRWSDKDARVTGGRGSVPMSKSVLLARWCSAGASLRGHVASVRKAEQRDRGLRIRPRVVLCCTSRQAMPGGGSSGARAPSVKPSSERSEGVSSEECRVIERRREASDRKHLFGGLGGGGVLVRDKASPFTGRRWKRAWPKRRKESRKGAPDEVEATGRERCGHRRLIRVEKPDGQRWLAEAERFAVNETLDRGAEGFRSPRESVAARDVDVRR